MMPSGGELGAGRRSKRKSSTSQRTSLAYRVNGGVVTDVVDLDDVMAAPFGSQPNLYTTDDKLQVDVGYSDSLEATR